jgi:hypothetical protein
VAGKNKKNMNKFRAIVALLMGINAGMNITSNIWNPSTEKIPMAIFYVAIAGIWIFMIKEPKPIKEDAKEETTVVKQ